MDIVQTFYDNIASHYDKLFLNWNNTINEQADILDKIFEGNGYDKSCKILDCACGIGTQSIGLALTGYDVTASDISDCELKVAKQRATEHNVDICFENADFRELSKTFSDKFDIIIAMDNALPHMLTKQHLECAIESIVNQLSDGGMFVASIRDYDTLVKTKPPYSPPYIHQTDNGQRVSFQTWQWSGDCYKLIQYIIDDENALSVNKFECEYRAVLREELTDILVSKGCTVTWQYPEQTGFYQPVVIAKKQVLCL